MGKWTGSRGDRPDQFSPVRTRGYNVAAMVLLASATKSLPSFLVAADIADDVKVESGAITKDISAMASPILTDGPSFTALRSKANLRMKNKRGIGEAGSTLKPLIGNAASDFEEDINRADNIKHDVYKQGHICHDVLEHGILPTGDRASTEQVTFCIDCAPPRNNLAPGKAIACNKMYDFFGGTLFFSGESRGVGKEGDNVVIPRVVDPEMRSVVDASAGSKYTLAVLDDHSVITLRIGRGVNKATPVSEVIDENGDVVDAPKFKKVFAGYHHSVFIDTRGSAYVAGFNKLGQLCFSGGNQDLPRKIAGLPDGEVAVDAAVGRFYTLILTDAGRVYGCGDNFRGQLGLGNEVEMTSNPESNGLKGVVRIAAGAHHSLVFNHEGLFVMGYNLNGQLCTGDYVHRLTPQLIYDDIESFAAGSQGSYLLLVNGTVKACGLNTFGELGDGTTVESSTGTFVKLDRLSSNVTTVIAGNGGASAFLRTQDGNLYGMGYNFEGQLGVGDNGGHIIPTPVRFNGTAPSTGVSTADENTLFW
ncbi:hypothetical protein ACHAWF_011111 [Thalassiosira exigua]